MSVSPIESIENKSIENNSIENKSNEIHAKDGLNNDINQMIYETIHRIVNICVVDNKLYILQKRFEFDDCSHGCTVTIVDCSDFSKQTAITFNIAYDQLLVCQRLKKIHLLWLGRYNSCDMMNVYDNAGVIKLAKFQCGRRKDVYKKCIKHTTVLFVELSQSEECYVVLDRDNFVTIQNMKGKQLRSISALDPLHYWPANLFGFKVGSEYNEYYSRSTHYVLHHQTIYHHNRLLNVLCGFDFVNRKHVAIELPESFKNNYNSLKVCNNVLYFQSEDTIIGVDLQIDQFKLLSHFDCTPSSPIGRYNFRDDCECIFFVNMPHYSVIHKETNYIVRSVGNSANSFYRIYMYHTLNSTRLRIFK